MSYGFTEDQAREFLGREFERTAASSSFYWESDELEEALDLLSDAVAKLLAENNRRYAADFEREFDRQMRAAGL